MAATWSRAAVRCLLICSSCLNEPGPAWAVIFVPSCITVCRVTNPSPLKNSEHLREDLVQRIMVGQAEVGQGMMINREEARQPAKAGIVLAASLDLSR